MKYSYLKPRTKTALTKEIQLLFTFFSVTILMLFITYAFLLFRDYRFEQDRITISQKKEDLRLGISKMNKQIALIEKQSMLSEKVFTKNSVLKDSINNLFDLVPGRITLSQVQIKEDGLVLYGVTPNKDVYNFMLQAPLRSIFHRTYSSFYPADNGWLRFVSTNYIDEEEIESEN
ncbi:MAG: hypothetical protein OQK48_04260 [Sulfurimonas sp.]|uniref:hypothetical protein n=1 Tax=Sulfurimonas sp. TaxID=2022749 RepID=UPI00262CCF38|nr:hypothetical protein [Sulfurimonas sp.]MCW8895800.1 hypothetical protein [Sulfurimonas sp.]MCW8954134.1 hypothetical protein [Sulfurimonas sp.]MCW9068046.1 hypothetical protein [Sulfurimonas sp.]